MVPLLDPISVNSVTWDKSLRKSSIATNSLLTGSYYRQQEDAKLISKEIDNHNVATVRLLNAGNAIDLIHKKNMKVTIVKTQSATNTHITDYSVFHDYAGLSKFSETKKTLNHILDNKLAYKNKGMWSSRSVSLEQLLKPILLSKPTHYLELLGQLMSVNNHICLVDTILVCSNISGDKNVNEISSFYQNEDINDVRYGFNHLSSYWSFENETFVGKKQWYDKIDINHMVLSLINDKDLERGRIKLHNTADDSLKDDLVTSLLKSSKGMKFESALASKKRISSEGSYPTQAMLMATTVDGILHIRPLCTSGDVVLALHELLDVNIFSSGCIQIPNIVPVDFQRHTEGFYRYTYQLNHNGKWQYLIKKLPFGLQNLYHFIHPSYVDHQMVFEIQDLTDIDDVPLCLKNSSIQMAKAVLAYYGKKKLVQAFHLDFEICFDTTKISKTSKLNKKRNIKKPFPPHLHKEFCSLKCYIYRLIQITGMEFKECIATYRRDAILNLNPDVKFQNYLQNFELYFKEQWKQVLKDNIQTNVSNHANSANNNSISMMGQSLYVVRNKEENYTLLSNKYSYDGSKLAAFQLAQKLRLNYSLLDHDTSDSDDAMNDEIVSMDDSGGESFEEEECDILPMITVISASVFEPKDTLFSFAHQRSNNHKLQNDSILNNMHNTIDTSFNINSKPSINYTPKPPSSVKKSNKSSRKKNLKLQTKVIPSFEDSCCSNSINESIDEKILRKFRYEEEKRIESDRRLHDEYIRAQQKAARMAAHAEAMRAAIKQGVTIAVSDKIDTIPESRNEENGNSGETEDRNGLITSAHITSKRISAYNSKSSREKRNFKNHASIDNDSSNELYRKLIDKAGEDYLAQLRDKDSLTLNDKIISLDRRKFNARELYLFNNTINTPSKHIRSPENMITDLVKRLPEKDIEQEQEQNVDRNDIEYDKKAYQLAEMIDPSYLVGRFNGANHRSGKSIHIIKCTEDTLSSEDENQTHEISVAVNPDELNSYRKITTLKERKNIAKEKLKVVKREAIERKEKLKKGAQDMLEQLLNKLPQHLASKIRYTLEKHELKKKKKLLKQQTKKKRMDLLVNLLKTDNVCKDSSSDSDSVNKISKRKVLTEKRKSMLKINDDAVDLANKDLDAIETDVLSCNSSNSEKNSIHKEMDLTDSDNQSNNSDDDIDDVDVDINWIVNEIEFTGSDIDSTEIDMINDRRVVESVMNIMVSQIVTETSSDNYNNNNNNVKCLVVQSNNSNLTIEDSNSISNLSENLKTCDKNSVSKDVDKMSSRCKRFSLQTTRKFSLMNLAKVMFDGNMMINTVHVDDISIAKSLDDISCSIVEESTMLDMKDSHRLTSPIISVRVSTAPKAAVLVPHEPAFHYNQKDTFNTKIINSLGLNSTLENDSSEYFQSEFMNKLETREPKLGSLWKTSSYDKIDYEYVKKELLVDSAKKELLVDSNSNLPEIENNYETFPTIEINDLISEVKIVVNPTMSDSLLSRKTNHVLNPPSPNLDINTLPAFLKPKQIKKYKYTKQPPYNTNPCKNIKLHDEFHLKKIEIEETIPSNKGLYLIIKNNQRNSNV